mmetsp:Transcript_62748/g.75491  ORF Transcript_62748/g.75491 Transcript_62748/m.75491 type:complete len:86 (-) Transcript_62748:249-506(-)
MEHFNSRQHGENNNHLDRIHHPHENRTHCSILSAGQIEDTQIANGPIHEESNTRVSSFGNQDYSATQERMMNPFLKNIPNKTNNW